VFPNPNPWPNLKDDELRAAKNWTTYTSVELVAKVEAERHSGVTRDLMTLFDKVHDIYGHEDWIPVQGQLVSVASLPHRQDNDQGQDDAENEAEAVTENEAEALTVFVLCERTGGGWHVSVRPPSMTPDELYEAAKRHAKRAEAVAFSMHESFGAEFYQDEMYEDHEWEDGKELVAAGKDGWSTYRWGGSYAPRKDLIYEVVVSEVEEVRVRDRVRWKRCV